MLKYLFVLSILFSFPFYSQTGGNVENDSLEKLYQKSSEALKSYQYLNTIKSSLELIDRSSEVNNYNYLYHGYNLLGITYSRMEDMERAEENYLKALENALASKNDTILWWAYNNLGNIYSQNDQTINKGLAYYDKAISIVTRIGDFKDGIDPIINKGWTFLDEEQYDRALPYLLKVKNISGPDKDPVLASQLKTLFGRYYAGKKEYDIAKCFFEASLQIAEKDSLIMEAADGYKHFAAMLYQSNAPGEAYIALQKHLEYQNLIFKEKKLHQMEAAYSRFKTDRYRRDLALAKREQQYKDEVIAKSKQISTIFIVFSVLLLICLILLYRNNRIRKNLINQQKEKNEELRIAKEEAERLSLLKAKFFSTVSHELRTPLYGVVGLASLLLEDNKDLKKEEDLKSLKFSADYLLALINDVLQMNKMESNLMHLENTTFKIEDLMTGIVKSFEFSRHQNSNKIELEIDKTIPEYLIGDSIRLSQVLMNLVGNAIKFTENGRIWIKAKRRKCLERKCLIYFEIGDTGLGIPLNKQEEIFEEFSQLKSTNYNYQGTGLGLPIVKKLLHLFGSEIRLKSEEGKGSVFGFEIEFEQAGTPKMRPRSKPVPSGEHFASENLQKRTALIVDDNRINQIVTRRILEKRNIKCKLAGSGNEAIEILKNSTFDFVLMDVNMPGMSGLQATSEIRKFDSETPIIALTAVEIEEMRSEILASGMNDIIVKPYD
ncbi:MAG TPA: response regulator, partial [Salinimicrobium sp.]|nr:response regulator [Salinimicrobium sp.]